VFRRARDARSSVASFLPIIIVRAESSDLVGVTAVIFVLSITVMLIGIVSRADAGARCARPTPVRRRIPNARRPDSRSALHARTGRPGARAGANGQPVDRARRPTAGAAGAPPGVGRRGTDARRRWNPAGVAGPGRYGPRRPRRPPAAGPGSEALRPTRADRDLGPHPMGARSRVVFHRRDHQHGLRFRRPAGNIPILDGTGPSLAPHARPGTRSPRSSRSTAAGRRPSHFTFPVLPRHRGRTCAPPWADPSDRWKRSWSRARTRSRRPASAGTSSSMARSRSS